MGGYIMTYQHIMNSRITAARAKLTDYDKVLNAMKKQIESGEHQAKVAQAALYTNDSIVKGINGAIRQDQAQALQEQKQRYSEVSNAYALQKQASEQLFEALLG